VIELLKTEISEIKKAKKNKAQPNPLTLTEGNLALLLPKPNSLPHPTPKENQVMLRKKPPHHHLIDNKPMVTDDQFLEKHLTKINPPKLNQLPLLLLTVRENP
jgi:hypothetical protein